MTLTPRQIRDIRDLLHGRIHTGVPLSRFTSFRIGGPADLVAEPQDVRQLAVLLNYLSAEKIPRDSSRSGNELTLSRCGFPGCGSSDGFH